VLSLGKRKLKIKQQRQGNQPNLYQSFVVKAALVHLNFSVVTALKVIYEDLGLSLMTKILQPFCSTVPAANQ
jgi:hypothetical protein